MNMYNNRGFSGNYSPNYNRQRGYNQAPKKKSGASFKNVEGGAIIVSAWRVSNRQLITLYARPYSKTQIIESKNGKKWANLFVTITNKTAMTSTNTSALLDIDKKRLYLKEFNMIVTNGGRGGYFGRHMGK